MTQNPTPTSDDPPPSSHHRSDRPLPPPPPPGAMIPETLIDRTPPGDEMRHCHRQPRPVYRHASNPKKKARAEGRAPAIDQEGADGGVELAEEAAESGRERLKRHRMEMGGRVWIPEIWGHESLLDDWIDGSVFDRSLVPKGLTSAQEALVHCSRQTTAAACRIKKPY